MGESLGRMSPPGNCVQSHAPQPCCTWSFLTSLGAIAAGGWGPAEGRGSTGLMLSFNCLMRVGVKILRSSQTFASFRALCFALSSARRANSRKAFTITLHGGRNIFPLISRDNQYIDLTLQIARPSLSPFFAPLARHGWPDTGARAYDLGELEQSPQPTRSQ